MGGNRRVILGAILFGLALATQKGTPVAEAAKKILPKAEIDGLAAALRQDPGRFFAQPVSFTWWLRGGEPGSGSDSLKFSSDGSGIHAIYIRARFNADYRPPMLSEQFAGDLNVKQATGILGPVLDSPLFREELPQEQKPRIADLQKETWEFARGAVALQKTLHEPFPDQLASGRAACREAMEYLTKTGQRTIRQPKPPSP
jgi:hypothetical protein